MKRIINKIKEMWHLSKLSVIIIGIIVLMGIVEVSVIVNGIGEEVKPEEVDMVITTNNMITTFNNTAIIRR